MTPPSPAAITGIGCICAAGRDLAAAMTSMAAGRRAPQPPVRFATGHPKRYPVFGIPDEFIPADLLARTDLLLTTRFALAATRQALADAGWDPAALRAARVGVCLGTTVGSALNIEDFYREYRAGGQPDLETIERFLRSNPAAAVSRELGLDGPVQTVVNACSSGTDAVGIAAAWLRAGACDVALAGGADELCRIIYNGFISLMITDDQPCRPFDRTRRGLNLGEGAAVLVLERPADAAARGARARAKVLGYGAACDAYHLTAPHPEGRGLRRAFAEALATAGVAPEDVAFINAHGTATPDNDRVEGRVLRDLFPRTPFVSTKGYTGHTLGAAGAIEAAFTVACLEAGSIPGNVGFAEADPEIGATPAALPLAIRGGVAISDSLAFGGNNAVLVLGRGDR
jgi:3-oxoacyl-[acyl-carrier-protein] synthase-1/3-oxoacyl-[acyl-carrier-protein] synthase II